jgi:hypothetical protein
VLPPLTEHGDLPPGIHAAGWTEIEQRFGTGTQARVRAFSTLKRVYALARRTGLLRNFHVFGSFVSSIPEPRDVDVVLIMAAHFRIEDCPSESQPLFWHLQAEARYGASVFWFKEGTASTQYLRGWQLKRDGTLSGIVEVA